MSFPKPTKPEKKAPAKIKRGKKPAKVRKTKRGTTKRKCDAAFAKWIRERDGNVCQSSGEPTLHPQCAHGFSRRYLGTRWDPSNAWCLSREEHMRFTHDPIRWDLWMRHRLGDGPYKDLRLKALLPCPKVDYEALLAEIESGTGVYAR